MQNATPDQHEHFAGIYVENEGKVRRVLRSMLKAEHQDLVDDFAQEVWLVVWRNILNGTLMTSPSGLVVVMARRQVTRHYQLARVRREVPTDAGSWQMDAAAYAADQLVAA